MANTLQLIIQAIDQASGTLDTIGKKGTGMSADLEKSFIKVGAALTGIGISAKLAADNINQAFLGFEGAMTEVKALGVATDELEKMRQKALDLSRDMPLSASDVADAMYLMVSVGWDAEEMMTAIEPASKLAVAGSVDLKDATNAVINAMEAYKDTGLTATQATEIFAKGVGVGKWELNDFLAEMMKNINVASELGIGFQELAAYNVALQNSFVDSSEAGSALKMMLMNLVEQQVIDKLGAMGVAVSDANGNFRGMIPIMSDLDDVLNAHYTEVERNTILTELFGARSVNAANALMRQKDELPGLIAEMGDASFMYDQFNTKVNSVGSQLQIANNRMEEAKIALGEAMVPATLAAAGAMSTFASVLTDLPGPLQTAVGGFLQFAQVLIPIGPLLMALPSLIGGVTAVAGGLSTGLAGMSAALTAGTVAVGGITIALGPLVLAIAGVVAAVAALYLAWESNFLGIQDIVGTFKDYAVDRFEGVKSAFGNMTSSLSPHVEKLKAAFGDLFGEINELFEKMTGGISISEALGKILEVVGKVVDTVLNVAFKALGGLIGILIDAISLFIEGLTSLVDWFGKVANHPIAVFFRETLFGAIKLVIEKIEAFCSAINTLVSNSDAMVSNIKAGWESINKTVSDKVSEMGQAFETFCTNAATAFEGLRTTIVDKITDAIETASNKLSEFKAFTSDVLSGVKDVFVDSFATIRDKIGDAITNIQDILPKLVDKAEEVATKIREKFFIAFDTVRDRISDAITNIQDLLPRLVDKVEEITTKIRDRFFSGWDAIADKVSAVIPSIGDTMSGLVTKAEDIVAKIHTRIFDGLDRIVSFFNETVDKIKSALAPIVTTIEGIITTIQDDFFKGLDFVVSLINDTVDKIRSALDPIITTIADLVGKIESAISTMADTIKARFDEVVNKVKEIVGPIIQTFSDLVDRIKAAFDTVAQKFNEVFKPVIEVFDSVRDAVQKVIQKIIDLVNHPAVQAIISVIGGPVSKLAEKFGIELTGSIDDSTDAVKDLGAAGAPSASLIGSAADKISGFLSGLLSPADNAKKGIENIGTAGDKMPGNISPGVEGTKSKINEIAATAKNVESTVNQTFAQIMTAAAQTAEYVAHSQSNANTSNYTGVVTDAQGNPVSVPAGYTSIGTANTAQTAPGAAALVNVSGEVLNTNSSYTGGVYTGPSQSSGNASGATAGAFDPTNADMTPAFIAQAGTSSSAKYAAFYVDPTSESGYSSRTITDTSVLNYWKNVGVPVKDYVWYMNHYVPAYNSGQDLTGVIPGLLALARGGIVMTPGLAMVGEAGPEIVSLNRGATVIPLDKTNQAIDYNLLADKIAGAVTRAIGSGVVRDLHLHGNFFGDEAAFRQLNRKLKSVNNMESVRTGV